MYPIFDSHAHYDDDLFSEDRDELLALMPSRGVGWIINNGSSIASSWVSVELAEKFSNVYAAVGVHPHHANEWNDEAETELRRLAAEPKVVAIGEIGLDYHYDFSPHEKQIEVLRTQISIAKELELPVVIHDREAHGDLYEILREFAPLSGVVHCFSGSAELAMETVALGMRIGLGGAVTFKNARRPLEVAEAVGMNNILLETDCPYMAPEPFRGRRCDSSMIKYVAEKLADVLNTAPEILIDRAARNTAELFGIDLDF